MNRKKVTKALLIAGAAALIVWDVYVVGQPASDADTISAVMLAWARAHPAIPFAIGFVFGHLLWPQKQP